MLMATKDDVTRRALALAASEWGGRVENGRLLPLQSSFAALVDDGKLSCSIIGGWRAVMAEPRQQDLAVKEIGARGVPVYLPMKWQAEKPRRGQVRASRRAMFGPYFFAKCEDRSEAWHKITSARGVKRIITTVEGHMGTVPDDAIALIRMHETQSARDFDDQRARLGLTGILWDFAPGEQVRIKTGAFAGFNADLTSAVDETGRIAALVSLLGRSTKIQLSAHDLEKL